MGGFSLGVIVPEYRMLEVAISDLGQWALELRNLQWRLEVIKPRTGPPYHATRAAVDTDIDLPERNPLDSSNIQNATVESLPPEVNFDGVS
ncbi:hypothetical protein J6590_020053 [Homalodisca vitripennis]|nr:hypothetical protein J6590_020053 [Homalodisca vitripennis]